VPYLLALTSAFVYGAADFLGGLTTRRADTFSVVIVSQFAGLLLLAVTVPFMPVIAVTRADVLWGVLAGVCGSTGVALLYRGLAVGTMAIVAPTTAVCAVLLPVAVSVAMGERLSMLVIAGIVLALIGIVLVGQEKWGRRSFVEDTRDGVSSTNDLRPHFPPGLGLAFLSGIAIGGFYLSLARANADAGMWPLLGARTGSVVLFVAAALLTGRTVRMPLAVTGMAIACGVVDMLANALYLAATWSGSLSVVVTLSSLYPASTVLLASLFLRERLNRVQIAGVVCALTAVVFIVSGR
jgi:uncharacterized membrane protein